MSVRLRSSRPTIGRPPIAASCNRPRPQATLARVAALLSILTGISRVYVGVHDPTAVIGGWIAGLLWAFVCWLAARQFEGTTHIRAERTKSA